METPLISPAEIAVLNAARATLIAVNRRAPHNWEGGFVAEATTTGEHAVFEALNVLNTYGEVAMTEAELYGPNHRPDEVEA